MSATPALNLLSEVDRLHALNKKLRAELQSSRQQADELAGALRGLLLTDGVKNDMTDFGGVKQRGAEEALSQYEATRKD